MTEELEQQARFIITTGKMIRDRVLQVHSKYIAENNGKKKKNVCADLSVTQMNAVLATHRRGKVTVSQLAEILNVSNPAASAMVERLVEKNVLTREHSREDRRKVVVQISPEVEEDIEQFEEYILKSFVDLVHKLGPETTQKWCDALKEVKAILEQEEATAK